MQFFAIVPACGHSRRMGQPKLLMPWNGQTVMGEVLDTWRESRVDSVVVVVRPGDRELAEVCRDKQCHLVQPSSDPTDMRESVEHGLRFVQDHLAPTDNDGWLLAPADMPALSSATIDRLLDQFQGQILVPVHNQKKGHPVLLPWTTAERVFELPPDTGVNQLIQESARFVETPESGSFSDIDTPDDYRNLRDQREP